MRRAQVFQYTLTGSDQLVLAAGNYTFTLSFAWPTVVQDQCDTIVSKITAMRNSDPLVFGNLINREYDYINYYLNIPDFGSGMEEWWEAQEYHPQSLIHKSDNVVYEILTERKQLCSEIDVCIRTLKEQLVWQMTCVDAQQEKTVMDLWPGGWARNQDSQYSIRVIAEIDTIGYNDLSKATLEIETYEFE